MEMDIFLGNNGLYLPSKIFFHPFFFHLSIVTLSLKGGSDGSEPRGPAWAHPGLLLFERLDHLSNYIGSDTFLSHNTLK